MFGRMLLERVFIIYVFRRGSMVCSSRCTITSSRVTTAVEGMTLVHMCCHEFTCLLTVAGHGETTGPVFLCEPWLNLGTNLRAPHLGKLRAMHFKSSCGLRLGKE